MDSIKVKSDDLARLGKILSGAPEWGPTLVHRNMKVLGGRLTYIMRQTVKQHRYTGAFEDGMTWKYDPSVRRLEVGSITKRGNKWDAGLLLEEGTGPIPNLPFGPIKAWAEFRGLPAGPIWWKIKTKGVSAHPWLENVVSDGRTVTAIENTAKRIGIDLVAYPFKKFTGYGGLVTEEIGPITALGLAGEGA